MGEHALLANHPLLTQFAAYFSSQIEPKLAALGELRETWLKRAMLNRSLELASAEQSFAIKNDYIHQLTTLINDYCLTQGYQRGELAAHRQGLSQIPVIAYFNDLYLGEGLSGIYAEVDYALSYGMLADTGWVAAVQPNNFFDHVILYDLIFPTAFPFKLISWHKDFLLDLVERRETHHLQRVNLLDAPSRGQLFKIYADDPGLAGALMRTQFMELLTTLIDHNGGHPIDFSINDRRFSLICRGIDVPFALNVEPDRQPRLCVQDDLLQLLRQVVLVACLIDFLKQSIT